jgi:hypothetical protein
MADLIDRLAGTPALETDGRPKINLHRWMGVQRLYTGGEWTRAQIVAEFGLQGGEATQAGQLADKVDSFTGGSGPLNKVIYLGRIEGVLMCMEDGNDRLYHNADGTLNRAKVLEDLQITG